MNNTDEVVFLKNLAAKELNKLKTMPQPVVRVCGPLTCDGPEGYEKNAHRLERAVEILRERGMTVWSANGGELEIKKRNCSHANVCNHFHGPILTSGLIAQAYFLPRWEESKGARFERKTAKASGVSIKEFPEEWFQE